MHDASRNSAGVLRKGYKVTDVRETVGARHPLVRTDRQTGRKALFLGRRPNSDVSGMSVPTARRSSMHCGRMPPRGGLPCAMSGGWVMC